MSFRPYIIEITGSAQATEGKHYVQNLVAGSASDGSIIIENELNYDPKKHTIIGNVVFDKKLRAVPYATYVANGSVGIPKGARPGTDFSICPGFYPAFAYFKEYINELRGCLDVTVDTRVKDLYYNGLYIATFSILELFLCDLLMCGVFWKEEYYLRALIKFGVKERPDQFVVEEKLRNAVYSKVFHRFEEIEDIFCSVFGFGFPNRQELDEKIESRHNIIHRFALSKQDRMIVRDASHESVKGLILTICQFVEEMKILCGLSESEREALR